MQMNFAEMPAATTSAPDVQAAFNSLPSEHVRVRFSFDSVPRPQIGPQQPPIQNSNMVGFRVPSPVPTEAREKALDLLEEKKAKQRMKIDGVGQFLRNMRQPDSVPEDNHIQFEIMVQPVHNSLTEPVHVSVHSPGSRSSGSSLSGPLSSGITPTAGPSSMGPPSLDSHGRPLYTRYVNSVVPQQGPGGPRFVPQYDSLGPDDIPPPPPHPTDPREIRKLMRSKMHRCKRCKNRFVEKGLLERHLRDKHPEDYIVYMAEQEDEMERQREEELEQMRIEEIQCGGFIPPASEVEAGNFDVDPEEIKLPGEDYGGVAPSFDRFGALKIPRRPYKKKISPQCPFCDKRFRNENSLKKHIAKKHQDAIEYVQCNKCYKCLKTLEELRQHSCALSFVCYECTPIRNLITEQRLFNHRAKFHRGANSGFKCNECNRKFLTPRKLRKHKKMAHVITKPFKCNFCDEFFPTETQVALHERIHTGKIRYECNVCDYKANRYIKLDKHRKEEHGYLCSICQEKIGQWAELKHHTLDKHGGYLTNERSARCIESPRVWILYKGE